MPVQKKKSTSKRSAAGKRTSARRSTTEIIIKDLAEMKEVLTVLVKEIQNMSKKIDELIIIRKNEGLKNEDVVDDIIDDDSAGEKNNSDKTSEGIREIPDENELRERFPDMLKEILRDIKEKNPDKEYVKIIDVYRQIKERFGIPEDLFKTLLLECHWKKIIELIPGTGEYSVKDHYNTVYHNIKL